MNPFDTGRPAHVDSHKVRSHADLVALIYGMHNDFDGSGKDEWTNATLGDYLEAMSALAEAMPQLYKNLGEPMPEQPTWEMVAILIAGATGHE